MEKELSNSLKLLLEKFVSTEFLCNFRIMNLELSLLKNLKTKLVRLLIALNDDSGDVNDVFVTLKDIVFQVNNLVDLINTEALPYKLDPQYETLTLPFSLQQFNHASNFKLRKLIERLEFKNFVELSIDQESLLKVGEEYFDELLSRSLIHQRSISYEKPNFEMHNFVYDLAIAASCIRFDKQYQRERIHHSSYKRGLYDSYNEFDKLFFSYNRGLYDSYKKFDNLHGLKGLHTFLALPLQKHFPLCLLSNKVVDDLLPKMKQLYVLSLSSYKSIIEVPNSIGNMLYLRFLNLSYTKIEKLPSEICNLYNLQFLLLSSCKRLTELPDDMGKLINLQYLDISDTALREMPIQITKLENLQTLSDFVVSKHNDGLKVAELGKFIHLHGTLSISQLQNVKDPLEAFQANMKMKEGIRELTLEWDCSSILSDSQIQHVVLEHLQPSTNLKSLIIKGYGGLNFPSWLGDFLFSNMVYLKISNCNECLWLPPLGQLGNLKELIIEGMKLLPTIGTEFYGRDSSSLQSFPSLETLHFDDMQEWEE